MMAMEKWLLEMELELQRKAETEDVSTGPFCNGLADINFLSYFLTDIFYIKSSNLCSLKISGLYIMQY